jgi:hypothetical protein
MMTIARLGFVPCLLLALFPAISHAGCDGATTQPKPAWVDTPETVTDQFYFAAGVSDKGNAPLAERIASAKQNALKNLSEIITVDVKNALVMDQSMKKTGSVALSETTLQSITRTSTSASLKNVETVSSWVDPQSCLAWLQVRVSKENVEHSKREGVSRQLFASLNTQLAAAQDTAATTDARLAAVDAALDTLPRIEFGFIPEASSAAYYTQQLQGLKQSLSGMQAGAEQAKKQLADASALADKAAMQNNESDKSRDILAAIRIYRALLSQHPKGLEHQFGPGDLYFKLGEAEELRGNKCGAKDYYLQSADASQVIARQPIARKRAEALPCSAEDMEKSRWRLFFEGRKVELICYFSTPPDRGHWQKTCDSVGNVIHSLGADVAIKTNALPEGFIGKLQQGEIPASLSDKKDLTMVYFASGKMNKRKDRENPGGGKEYQFAGLIGAVMIDSGQLVFSDRFQGTTGWNPVSSEMTMDVLALNVVKRWQDKFSKFLRHEVDQ